MQVKSKEVPNKTDVLPSDWEVQPLAAVVDPSRPISYGIVQTGPSVYNGVRCVRVIDLDNGSVDIEKLITTSAEISNAYKRTILRSNDLMIALRGKIGELAIVNAELAGANLTRGLAIISSRPDRNHLYLYHYLSSPMSKGVLERNLNGSALQEIPIATLRKVPVILPPQNEQRAIAEALSDVDSLLKSLVRLIEKKREIKDATIQQLLTGKRRLAPFEKTPLQSSEIGLLPKDWRTMSLGDATTKIGSGITPTGGERVYKTEGRPFVRSQNVGWGRLILDDIAFIDEQTHASFPATELKEGDVLLNITGASIGRSALADKRLRGGNVNQHVCIVRPTPSMLDALFLNLVLLSDTGQRQIDSFQAGGNRQGLNFGQIRNIQVPVPSLEEQQAISIIAADLDSELSMLEDRWEKTLLVKQGMMQQLLTGGVRLV